MKVYGKPTNHCYKIEVREKDLDKANLNSEWMEERVEEEPFETRGQWYEESAEETEMEVTYTP
ncbi:hypothetical protein A2U01_0110666, partial [Trifolium medium]|nr:hypothetical protein [Trifolium medium]